MRTATSASAAARHRRCRRWQQQHRRPQPSPASTTRTRARWRQLQTHMRHTQFVDAEMVRQRGVVGRLGQTTFEFADDAAFNARMQCAWFRACVAPGSTAMSSTGACGTEGGGCLADGCAVSAVFARPARAPPTRGSSRRRGQAAGFTPTVQILALLLPIFREKRAGSGANSERIAELLHRNAELAGRQYLVPRLDQLGKWWTEENTRKNSPLLAIGSLVVAVGKPKPRDVQGDSAPARKKQAKEAPTGKGVVIGRNGPWWYVDFGDGKPPGFWAFHAKSLELTAGDPLHGQPTHDGRPDKKKKRQKFKHKNKTVTTLAGVRSTTVTTLAGVHPRTHAGLRKNVVGGRRTNAPLPACLGRVVRIQRNRTNETR